MFKIIKTKKLKEMKKDLFEANEKIKNYQSELDEIKVILDIRVKAKTRQFQEEAQNFENKFKQRTKELTERLNELERFHRLSVGRELKMIELKKELERSRKLN